MSQPIDNRPVTALVPCRAGSERIKSKTTRPFAGSSLFEIKLRQLLATPEIDEVMVSTDDPVIEEMASEVGGPRLRVVEREAYYASSACNTDELSAYFARSLPVTGHLLWTHVTSPFITSEHYGRAVRAYRASDRHDSLVSVFTLKEFVWNAKAEPVNYGSYTGRWPKTQDLERLYMINSGIFLIDIVLMRELNDRVGRTPYLFECDAVESLDVDDEADFALAERLYQTMQA
jgi:CMP-N-acetylneuraminic acid synthetase